MSFNYMFGSVICAFDGPTLLNTNLQFFRVVNRAEKKYGWAWEVDDDIDMDGEANRGGYVYDPHEAIDDLVKTLKEYLETELEEYLHPESEEDELDPST